MPSKETLKKLREAAFAQGGTPEAVAPDPDAEPEDLLDEEEPTMQPEPITGTAGAPGGGNLKEQLDALTAVDSDVFRKLKQGVAGEQESRQDRTKRVMKFLRS